MQSKKWFDHNFLLQRQIYALDRNAHIDMFIDYLLSRGNYLCL